jgi:hypothetical protein
MKKLLVGSLLFWSSLAYAGERHSEAINNPIVDVGPGAHIKGPLKLYFLFAKTVSLISKLALPGSSYFPVSRHC